MIRGYIFLLWIIQNERLQLQTANRSEAIQKVEALFPIVKESATGVIATHEG